MLGGCERRREGFRFALGQSSTGYVLEKWQDSYLLDALSCYTYNPVFSFHCLAPKPQYYFGDWNKVSHDVDVV